MKNYGGRSLLPILAASLLSLRASGAQNPPANSQTKAAEPAAKELPQPMAYDKAFPVAKECADKFLNGTGGELWDKMTPEMQQALGNDRTKWEVMSGGVGQQIGKGGSERADASGAATAGLHATNPSGRSPGPAKGK